MRSLRIVIVDDEPPARRRLQQLLEEQEDVLVVGEARDIAEAGAVIEGLRPDLVFLDIRMPGGTGFDLLERLSEPLPSIVFVTAFDQHAVQAFEADAVDYLLKPVAAERLAQCLDRVRRDQTAAVDGALPSLGTLLGGESSIQRLAIRVGGRIRILPVHEIDFLQSSGNYVHVHAGSARHVLRETLAGMESRLDPATFIRIHRSTIVNVERVRELESALHGDYAVKLEDGRRLMMSRSFRDRLRGRFGPEF